MNAWLPRYRCYATLPTEFLKQHIRMCICDKCNVLYFPHPSFLIDLFFGAQPLHTITKPPRALVHHYGNGQVLVKYWNKWMPAKCISQRCYFHRAGFFRFVHRKHTIYLSEMTVNKGVSGMNSLPVILCHASFL